ncbi:Thiosulfate sulfurtransferase PspE [BD1-7 clade bacterium]|uniref:Thiosulfate sulfurtransferase PspE n=1 Tax=BD1-7 clade bacterium TaxID=2029982 RepID=A0A5S9MS66_9GAMM|nr:Thiosulfate sulfurtransferase PspE [BD1-7 clade bacterium]
MKQSWISGFLAFMLMLAMPVLASVPAMHNADANNAPETVQRIVWIDVRSKAEHFIDRIDGDMRTDWEAIVPFAESQFSDKNQPMALYCRSGNRAGKAKAALEAAGFTSVINAGSIGDARAARTTELAAEQCQKGDSTIEGC